MAGKMICRSSPSSRLLASDVVAAVSSCSFSMALHRSSSKLNISSETTSAHSCQAERHPPAIRASTTKQKNGIIVQKMDILLAAWWSFSQLVNVTHHLTVNFALLSMTFPKRKLFRHNTFGIGRESSRAETIWKFLAKGQGRKELNKKKIRSKERKRNNRNNKNGRVFSLFDAHL